MANPRVFISSTYYDLKFVRDDIGNFLRTLGYDPIMHDKGNVTYSQTTTLENSCYEELSTCDIVVCIVGSKYGTKSDGSDYSITMQELLTAIKSKKKIYIFIANDVYIENNIYMENKGNVFTPKYADNIKIHEFISEIKENIRNHPIQSFNNVADIIECLKKQFAGLFQHLLNQEAAATEGNTYYDLEEITNKINNMIVSFDQQKEEFFRKFDGTIFASNRVIYLLRRKLNIENFDLSIIDDKGLEEFMRLIGFEYNVDSPITEYGGTYTKNIEGKRISITFLTELFESDGTIKNIRSLSEVEELLKVEEEDLNPMNNFDEDDDLPF